MKKASHYVYYGDDEEDEMDIDLNNNVQVDSLNNPFSAPHPNTNQQQPLFSVQPNQQQSPFGYPQTAFGSSPNIQRNSNNSNNSNYNNPFGNYNNPNIAKTKVKKANTNVLAVDLGSISKVSTMATGDPVFCKSCKSVFSNINSFKEIKLKENEVTKNVPTSGGLNNDKWTCEFCSEVNDVFLVPEEIPTSNIVDFILEHAPITNTDNNNTNNTKPKDDESMVLFCIDTSGSMECTMNVPGGIKKPQQQTQKHTGLFGEKPPVLAQYISRLECVQIGIENQLEEMVKTTPSRRVGVVSFSEEVKILSNENTTHEIKDDKLLNSVANLLENAVKYEITQPLVKTKSNLIDSVYKLNGSGSTALGPAIATCIGMASKNPASKIIICTDGCANKGVGNLDGDEINSFYDQMGNIAQKNGTSISVLTIKGTDCRMEFLGALAEKTGGEVNIVDPLKLDQDFKEILALPVVATNVQIKLILHSGLYVSDNGQISANSFLEKVIGNVNEETSYTFEYGFKKGSNISKDLKSLPFQLQIYYTTLSGMKCVRVITNTQELTNSKDLAEEFADVEVLGQNIVQASSNVAVTGDYQQSRAKNIQGTSILQRVMQKQQNNPIFDQNYQQQQVESAKVWLSQAQKLEDTLSTELHKKGNKSFKKSERSDETSNVLFNMKNMNNSKAKKFSK